MKNCFLILIFLFIGGFASGKDHVNIVKLKFSPVKDTIVCGMENEMVVTTEYNNQQLVVTATNCTISVKNQKKGIYSITASASNVGKPAVIYISVKNKNGTLTKVHSQEVPVVRLSLRMQNQYFNKK